MAELIVAVDPGKTTGIATYEVATGTFTAGEYDFDQTCITLADYADTLRTDMVLVSEAFLITPQTAKNTQAPWSLELIGVMRYLSRTRCWRDLTLQTPSQAKHFSSDNRLRTVGFWTPGKGHANDAARHLLVYTATHGILPYETLTQLVDIA